MTASHVAELARRFDPVPLFAVAAFCIIPIVSGDPSTQNTLTLAMVWTFWALSLNVVWGFGGQFSMAQVALGGLAAYAFSLFVTKDGMNQLLAVVLATMGSVLASVIIAAICLRLEDFRFAIMTLAFALAGVGLASGLAVTGQSAGLNVPSHWAKLNLGLFHWDLDGRLGGFTALMVVCFLAITLGLKILLGRRPGRGMLAIREDATLAESLGIAAGYHRILAFGLSAVVASLAGVFQAEYYGYIFPDLFSFDTLVSVIVVLTLGGRGRLFGPLIGGILYATLTNVIHLGGRFQETVFGALVIVITILARHGLSYYLGQGEKSVVQLILDPTARAKLASRLRDGSNFRRGKASAIVVTAAEEALAETVETEPSAIGTMTDSLTEEETLELLRARQEHSVTERSAPVILEGEGMTKRFGGVTAVRDFSFQVRAGEILGLIGPNGAGKTTAFNLVSGFTRPDSGTLRWHGHQITRSSPHVRARQGLVRTFQQPRNFPALTVRENLVIAAQSHTARLRDDITAPSVDEVLETFEFGDLANTPTEQLSYGYAKRLGVAMAVATGCEMLMLDEPAAGLNGADVDHLREDLVRLRNQGRTVWIVEHHMELVVAVCDRVIVLDAGAVIATGSPDEVMAHPQVLEAYLGGAA